MPGRISARCIPILALVIAATLAPPALAQTPAADSTAVSHRGTVREDAFFSEALGVVKHVAVYLPPSYNWQPVERYPVAYYLHGLGGSETDWLSRGNIDVVADSLAASGAAEMIVVMPDADDSWYSTWTTQVSYAECADTVSTEAAGRFCVKYQRYDDYIVRDVVSYIDEHYRTISDRAHRGIGGLSMGGYGAVELSMRFPSVFSAAASHSGVLSALYTGPTPFVAPPVYAQSLDTLRPLRLAFVSRREIINGDNIIGWRLADPALTAETLKESRDPVPALFIDCGTSDPFVDQNRAFHWELERLGIAHEYAEWPGTHGWPYWNAHVGQSLAWMARHIGRR